MLDIGEEGTELRDEGAPRLSETAEARSQGYLRWVKEGQDPLSFPNRQAWTVYAMVVVASLARLVGRSVPGRTGRLWGSTRLCFAPSGSSSAAGPLS